MFREVLQCEYEITSVADIFLASENPKISYTESPLADELFFKSLPLLLKNNLEQQEISFTEFGGQKVPFAVDGSTLPFDIFSASFYLVSRYEEYLPFEGDKLGRFQPENSLQFQLGLLENPVIDNWALILKNILAKRFPNLTFTRRKFQFVPTIDIDRAYHFRASGVFKNLARISKAMLNFHWEKVKNMVYARLDPEKDPFDTYDLMRELHDKYNYKPVYFFLLALHGDKSYDVNEDAKDILLSNLIKQVSKYAEVGLHPSYASNSQPDLIKEEKDLLENRVNQTVTSSRQHYLKLSFPKTYLQLLKAGIHHDYSMGYASQVGFRAGTCTPFFWYDLQLEKQTSLRVHPFAVMDGTLNKYLKLSPEEGIAKIDRLLSNVKLVNGHFYSLWHNESLSETGNWKGWKIVYEQMLMDARLG